MHACKVQSVHNRPSESIAECSSLLINVCDLMALWPLYSPRLWRLHRSQTRELAACLSSGLCFEHTVRGSAVFNKLAPPPSRMHVPCNTHFVSFAVYALCRSVNHAHYSCFPFEGSWRILFVCVSFTPCMGQVQVAVTKFISSGSFITI